MIERIEDDLKQAMLARDKTKTTTLKGLKSELINEKIKQGNSLSAEQTIAIIKRELKKRGEAADLYRKAGQSDKASQEEDEAKILQEYLPPQLSQDELVEVIEESVGETGASNSEDIGKVMGSVLGKVEGRADSAEVAQLVKERLASE